MFKKSFIYICIILLPVLLTSGGCLHSPAPAAPAGNTTHPANTGITPEESTASPGAGAVPASEVTVTNDLAAGERDDEKNTDAKDESFSTRVLLEEARGLVCTGARQYLDGNLDSARANFDAALLNLQLADLPEDMQTIQFFQPYLPAECRTVNLEKAYRDVQQREMEPLEDIETGKPLPFATRDRVFIESEILRLMNVLGEEPVKPEELEIFSREVEHFIVYFQTRRREWFERSYYRMLKYRNTVESILAEKRLPPELAYLAFIESGYLYRATSRSRARGIWQFIRSTGRTYGLKIRRGIDERLDPVKSTIAAREYLLDLISIFGSKSFLLAMAAYNAGEGKIQRCLRRIDDPFENRSFWQIRTCLKKETREYIPRIIAAAIICENPHRFGFDLKSASEMAEQYDIVVCPRRVRLSSVAKAAGISLKQLRELNPDLPSGGYWTPVNNTHLWVPRGMGKPVEIALKKMSSPPPPPEAADYHIVRRGESLYKIGRRYKIPYKRLAAWNNIRYPYKIKPGQKIYLSPPGSTGTSRATQAAITQCTDSLVYVVQKGNYLAGIGSLFGVSARSIMALNNLKRGVIFPGQRLAICPAFPVTIIQHKVARGETLSKIARRYHVKVEDIKFSNGLKSDRNLRSGMTLTIYKKAG